MKRWLLERVTTDQTYVCSAATEQEARALAARETAVAAFHVWTSMPLHQGGSIEDLSAIIAETYMWLSIEDAICTEVTRQPDACRSCTLRNRCRT